jgi:hypothetical protein
MKTENLLIIVQAQKNLEKALHLLKSEDQYWRKDDLLLFADLKDKCNLFDFEFDKQCEKLPDYNS